MINKIYKAGGTFKIGPSPNSFPTKTEHREQCCGERGILVILRLRFSKVLPMRILCMMKVKRMCLHIF